jgi:hypothetical protein
MNKTETSRVSLIEQPNFGCSRYEQSTLGTRQGRRKTKEKQNQE